MLRRQTREEDSVVLINMASPEAGNDCSYGRTAQASQVPSTIGMVFSMKLPLFLLPRLQATRLLCAV